jgi:anti-sigma B factor antagonist
VEQGDDGHVEVTHLDGIVVAALRGDIDLANRGSLDVLLDSVEPGLPIVVDCSQVGFMDSTGLHALLRAMHGGHTLTVRNPSPQVRQLLELTGMPDLIEPAS